MPDNNRTAKHMVVDEENPSSSTTNPPLRILTKTPTRRRKGTRRKGSNNNNPNDKEMKGLLNILLVVAFFVAIEVIVVDHLFLGQHDIYNNVELRMLSSTHNVYLSDIVEAGWNRYYRAGELQNNILHRRRGGGDGSATTTTTAGQSKIEELIESEDVDIAAAEEAVEILQAEIAKDVTAQNADTE
jgi:hypothetical protein